MFWTVPLYIIGRFSLYTHTEFRPDPARKLSGNLCDTYHCCVYSEKLLMMDRGTTRKYVEFYSKNKFDEFVHLVGFIIRIMQRVQSNIVGRIPKHPTAHS